MLTVLSSICLCVSFAIAAWAVANLIISLRKKSDSVSDKLGKRKIITPFHVLVLGTFLAIMVALLPVHVYEQEPNSGWEIVFKVPLLAAQNTLQLFTINATFDNVGAAINTANDLHPALVRVYTLYVSFYFIIAPMLSAAFVLSFVKGLYENWRYFKNKDPQEIYVFSELNEHSLVLAKDIVRPEENGAQSDKGASGAPKTSAVDRMIVFTNITQKMQEEKAELVSAAKNLGAICLQKDITDVYLKDPKNKKILRKLYLISVDENENTSKAMQLIAQCHKDYNNDTTHVYVFANSDESGILLDSVIAKLSKKEENGKEIEVPFDIKVRRVNEKRNLIWNTLRQNARELGLSVPKKESESGSNKADETVPLIFSSAKDGKMKDIDVLIVGLGQYGTELLKTICWYCQMPGFRLRAHVFDGLPNCKEKVRSLAPGLVEHNTDPAQEEKILSDEKLANTGESYYEVYFHPSAIDVREASFADAIEGIAKKITLAFVTLGDDTMNIDTAIKLRRIFGKALASNKGHKVPPILTVVYDSEKTESLNYGKMLKNDSKDGDYGIRFIGDLRTSYSLLNIEQEGLERAGLSCHMHWAKVNQMSKQEELTEQQLQDDWQENVKKYNTYEYSRRSSMAQAMHLMAREQLCKGYDKQILTKNEHRRWDAFMRADGYTASPEDKKGKRLDKDTIAKIHPDLVDFDLLKPETQEKDNMPEYSQLTQNFQQKSTRFASAPETTEEKGSPK